MGFLRILILLYNTFFGHGVSMAQMGIKYAENEDANASSVVINEPLLKMEFLTQDPSTYFFDIGLFGGFVLILLLYSFLIFVNLKQPIFLWFFTYTFLVSVYLAFSERGLVLWNESWLTYFNILNSLFILFAFKSFFQRVLNTKLRYKVIHRWMDYLLLLAVGTVALQLAFPSSMVLVVLSRLVFLVVIGLLYYCIFNNPEITSVQFKLLHISIIALVLSGISLTLNKVGIEGPINLLLIGVLLLVLHIISYSMVMLYRIKKLNDTNDSLWQDIRQTKNQLLESHFTGIKEEQIRIMNEIQSTVLVDLDLLVENCRDKEKAIVGALYSVRNDLLLVSRELNPYKGNYTEKFVHKVVELVKSHETDGLEYQVVHFNQDVNLSTKVEEHLYRIIQEAVNNIEKYANATQVEIQVLLNGESLILSIEDNGVGFDVKKNRGGIGIVNMRNRVLAIDGTFHILSARGKGTSIIINLEL